MYEKFIIFGLLFQSYLAVETPAYIIGRGLWRKLSSCFDNVISSQTADIENIKFPYVVNDSIRVYPIRFLIYRIISVINPFVPSAPFLYPLKTSENLMFSGGRERVD